MNSRSKISPAIEKAKIENGDFVEAVGIENVKESISQILDRSLIINTMVKSGDVGILGGYYDVATGQVEFLKN